MTDLNFPGYSLDLLLQFNPKVKVRTDCLSMLYHSSLFLKSWPQMSTHEIHPALTGSFPPKLFPPLFPIIIILNQFYRSNEPPAQPFHPFYVSHHRQMCSIQLCMFTVAYEPGPQTCYPQPRSLPEISTAPTCGAQHCSLVAHTMSRMLVVDMRGLSRQHCLNLCCQGSVTQG